MTHADIIDVRASLSVRPAPQLLSVFDALIDDIYYYRLGVQDRLDALLQEFPEFVLAHVLKGYSLMTEGTLDAHPQARAHLLQAGGFACNRRERLHQEALRAWIAQDLLLVRRPGRKSWSSGHWICWHCVNTQARFSGPVTRDIKPK